MSYQIAALDREYAAWVEKQGLAHMGESEDPFDLLTGGGLNLDQIVWLKGWLRRRQMAQSEEVRTALGALRIAFQFIDYATYGTSGRARHCAFNDVVDLHEGPVSWANLSAARAVLPSDAPQPMRPVNHEAISESAVAELPDGTIGQQLGRAMQIAHGAANPEVMRCWIEAHRAVKAARALSR